MPQAGVRARNDEEEEEEREDESQLSEKGQEASESEEDDQTEVEEEERDEEGRMELTQEEYQFALAIKTAMEQDDEINTGLFSDFWCVQLAIVDKGNVEKALERTRNLQRFRQEYDIVEDQEYARRIFREFQQLLPEYWMAFDFNERDGNYTLIADLSKIYTRVLKASERNTRLWMSATYYMCHAMTPDFAAIRTGPIIMSENEGFDFKKNFGFALFEKLWAELAGVYPHRIQKLKNFNSGVLINVFTSMSRPFIPPDLYAKIEMGCQCGVGRLSDFFLMPTLQIANERLLQNVGSAMDKRYSNEASFTLKEADFLLE